MGELLRGRLSVSGYRALLCNLLAIYVALEDALEARQADRHLAPLHMPWLHRTKVLASDLIALGGAGTAAQQPVEEATSAYAERLAQLAQRGSPALVAHAYVRYLGDLYGGQTLRRVVVRAYGLNEAATRFYEFGSQAQVQAHRDAFRDGLAAVPASPAEADLIVDEARWAFEQHRRLFEQLALREAAA